MPYFDRLLYDGSLAITASEHTRWQQGQIIPPKVLQAYWDEGLPFVPEAPTTAMRLPTFLRKLDELAHGHCDAQVRQLAEYVRQDVSVSISGFDRIGKTDPRHRGKTRLIATDQKNWDGEKRRQAI
jgi:hypothetical protein